MVNDWDIGANANRITENIEQGHKERFTTIMGTVRLSTNNSVGEILWLGHNVLFNTTLAYSADFVIHIGILHLLSGASENCLL